MGLPILAKTWQHNVNNVQASVGSQAATSKRVLRLIKNAMKGFALNPWTVRGSSNTVSAGIDNVDRWTSDSDIVPGSDGSWIILENVWGGQLLIVTSRGDQPGVMWLRSYFSASANFTGGSTSTRPTATDENLLTDNSWGGPSGGDFTVIWNVQMSSDGECTRVWMWCQNQVSGFWLFDKPAQPITGWTTPHVSFMFGNHVFGSDILSLAFMAEAAQLKSRTPGGALMGVSMTCEFSQGAYLPNLHQYANDIDSKFQFYGIGLTSTTALARGACGVLYDLWWGAANQIQGSTFPVDTDPSPKQFVQARHIIFPWDSAAGTPVTQ